MATNEHRAVRWLHAYGRRYPDAWEQYAAFLEEPPMEWPSWCYCPLGGAHAILSAQVDPISAAADVGPLGAMAAWRPTQGIYRFDPTLFAELGTTDFEGDLPGDVLTRLPEWCVYIETPEFSFAEEPMAGFWAFLESDSNNGRGELRLVFDVAEPPDGTLLQAIIHLGGTVQAGIEAAMRLMPVPKSMATSMVGVFAEQQRLVGDLVNLVLYLCADDAEVAGQRPLPPKVVRTKKRALAPAAKAPLVHECGYRIGAALRAAREHASGEGAGVGGSRAAHVRRAHWHRYWTGPREGDRRLALHWLSPILVGVKDGVTEATLHPVTE